MKISTNRTVELMVKHYTGEITPAELKELEDFIAQKSPEKQRWYRDMLDPHKLAEAIAFGHKAAQDLPKHQKRWKANARKIISFF